MSDNGLDRATDEYFDMLAKEAIRLELNSREVRSAFCRQQREILEHDLVDSDLSPSQEELELLAFDNAVERLEDLVAAVSPRLHPYSDPYGEPATPRPPRSGRDDTARSAGHPRAPRGRRTLILAGGLVVVAVMAVGSVTYALRNQALPLVADLAGLAQVSAENSEEQGLDTQRAVNGGDTTKATPYPSTEFNTLMEMISSPLEVE